MSWLNSKDMDLPLLQCFRARSGQSIWRRWLLIALLLAPQTHAWWHDPPALAEDACAIAGSDYPDAPPSSSDPCPFCEHQAPLDLVGGHQLVAGIDSATIEHLPIAGIPARRSSGKHLLQQGRAPPRTDRA